MSLKSVNPGKLVIQRDIKGLKKYLDEGGDPNKKRRDWPHNTPLMDAVMESNIEIINLLLEKISEKGLNPNIICNEDGGNKTPLDVAEYKLERWRNATNRTIVQMLREAIKSYKKSKAATRVQSRYRGNKSRAESKSLGYLRRSQKIEDWPDLKRKMQASGFTPSEIERFHRDHYMAGKKKKKRKSKRRKSRKRRRSSKKKKK
tara:strand:+ start:1327 stop:1935 length:609 start_codon:yes stop_codon:yes gene_type:complete